MKFVVYQPNTIELEIEICAKANKKGSETSQFVWFLRYFFRILIENNVQFYLFFVNLVKYLQKICKWKL